MRARDIFVSIVLLTLFSSIAFGQEYDPPPFEKIKAEKIAFLTTKLELTVEEAQLFWPLYNEEEKKRDELMEENRNLMDKYLQKKKDLTGKEMETFTDRYVEIEIEMANITKNFHARYKKIFSAEKLFKYYHAEKQFKSELLRRMRDMHKEMPPPRQN